jgi:hypothetical protein
MNTFGWVILGVLVLACALILVKVCPLCEYCDNIHIDGKRAGCKEACPLYKQLGKGCVELDYLRNPRDFYLSLMKLKPYK